MSNGANETGVQALSSLPECMEINMANHVMGVATPVDNQLHQVIPVMQGTIGDQRASLVSARRLHNFLGVGRDFQQLDKVSY